MKTQKQPIIRLPNLRRMFALLASDHPRVLAVSAAKPARTRGRTAR